MAKIVKKCGNRKNWQEWAENIAKIANTHTDRIKAILENKENTAQIQAFNQFAGQLRNDLNTATTDNDAIEMLSQHLITKPIFDALFSESEFAKFNPMSIALDKVIDDLSLTNISDKETKELNDFYNAIAIRVSGIKEPAHRQKIIKELYDNFFNKAFPKLSEKMGIVYTPIEVVDFIIHSVEHILQTEFKASLSDDGVQIIDPFTGTGTFITRLLQSGIIDNKNLPIKYSQIHANEMLLLAYYIATINIESVYHSIMVDKLGIIDDYKPFTGICLADTFAMYENDLITLSDNSERQKRQKELDITVIMGNPPYSVGKKSANDSIENMKYPVLDSRIENSYAKYSNTTLKKSLYNSYVRAIRWASDRIGNNGVIGFVTSAGFIDSKAHSGLRKCLSDEFSSLYVFHLRGNANTSGELRRKEKDNVFGNNDKDKGSIKEPVAISVLVKNKKSSKNGNIYFYDIGDYLSRDEKLSIINEFKSIDGIKHWKTIIPDEFNDWINHRNTDFDKYISMYENGKLNIFLDYSNGIATSRDKWVYNSSKTNLLNQMKLCINFYNSELEKHVSSNDDYTLNLDEKRISWSDNTKKFIQRHLNSKFNISVLRKALYRPFFYQNVYFDKFWIERTLNNKIYPKAECENLVICLSLANKKDFSTIITNTIPDYHLIGDTKCFPLHIYEPNNNGDYTQKSAISDEALAHFKEFYNGAEISKECIFYYIYGLLHSTDYRERYADNLSKQLPRIPRVKSVDDFLAFEKAGRMLANLHLNYENVAMYDGVKLQGGIGIDVDNDKITGGDDDDFYVTKMKFAKRKNPQTGKNEDDKTVIIYNDNFIVNNIPLQAYNYVVNGKSAIEWVMERQSVKTDKASGITNDANDWAIETMNNAHYPLELLLRVITVSIESMNIVNNLPSLVIE
ncbi:type ISP restriction/modification enzyme [Moraxella bovis]